MDTPFKASMNQEHKHCRFTCRSLAGIALLLSGLFHSAQAQTTPITLSLASSTLVNINGNAGHVAANSAGDAFYVSQTDQVAYWVKHGTTTPIALVSGLSGGRSLYVDSSNNVYVPSNYSGVVVEVPYVNGTYVTGSVRSSLSSCSSATPTSPCLQFGNGGAGVSYYYQATDLGFDGSGKAYIVDAYDNNGTGGAGKFNAIEIFSYSGSSYSGNVLINNLPSTQSAQIAVDAKGDIYYADGTNLYTAPAGATAVTAFGSGLKTPSGVSVDKYGNVYVTDSGLDQILEFPALNGVAQTNVQLVFDPAYSANGVAFDGLGEMYYTAYASQTNLSVAHLNALNIGSAAVGATVSSTPLTVTLDFIKAQTLGTLTLAGSNAGFTLLAGTCIAGTGYSAAQTCNFNVNYKPTAVGVQRGAVVITNTAGSVIGIAELYGTGLGAAQTNDPGTATALGSGFTSPMGIAVDSAGDVFIADAGKNAVYEYASGSSTATTVGSGLSKPGSVALDNAGDVYIADSGNGRVVEVPNVAGTLTTSAQAVIISGLGSAIGVATDSFGNLYVADTNNNKVTQLASINGVPSTSASFAVTLPSSSVAPTALATDGTGNLFVADATANTITEIAYYGKASTNIGHGYSHPSGLATDASGSLYVADSANLRLIKIPFEPPIFNTNDQYSVGPPFSVATGVVVPYGVALDSAANLYVVDNADATVTYLNRSQGTLNLGSSNVGSTSTQENVYVADAGTQSLVLGSPAYTTTANAAFAITSPSGNGCTNAETILSGFSCVLAATFTPPATGSYSQTLNFSDNAANTAAPSVTITGQGLNVAATTLKLSQTSPSGTPAFGQVVTIAATISSGTAGSPSGDVIFYIDGGFYSVVKVSNGTASVNVSGLLGGTHTISASYTGDNTFASSSANLSITVVKASSALTLTAPQGGVVAANPPSAIPGSTVTLTATVVPNASTIPTGTVTFTVGSTTLGTASVVPLGGGYQATITTTTLPSGTDTVSATYAGDVNYFPSTGTLVFYVVPESYTLTPSTQSVTVSSAGSGTVPFQATSFAGFGNAYVALTCSGLPANTSCGFNPNGFILQPNNQLLAPQKDSNGNIIVPGTYGPVSINLIITTGTTPVVVPPVSTGELHLPWIGKGSVSLAFLGLAPLVFALRRKRAKKLRHIMSALLGLTLFACTVTMLSGCGSNLVGTTPAGTYQVKITATATMANGTTINGPLAAGCSYTPSGATVATCVQNAQVTLVVQ